MTRCSVSLLGPCGDQVVEVESISTECGDMPVPLAASSSFSSMTSNLSPKVALRALEALVGHQLVGREAQRRWPLRGSPCRSGSWRRTPPSGDSPDRRRARLAPIGRRAAMAATAPGATTDGSVIVASAKLPGEAHADGADALPPHSPCAFFASAAQPVDDRARAVGRPDVEFAPDAHRLEDLAHRVGRRRDPAGLAEQRRQERRHAGLDDAVGEAHHQRMQARHLMDHDHGGTAASNT